jgi:hypothetical protein
MSAYVFFKVSEFLDEPGHDQYSMIKRRLLDEGIYGADFIMRLRAPSGSFFRSVSRGDALDRVEGTRKIEFEYRKSSDQFSEAAATANEEIIGEENYEVSLRSGGGTSIAVLAAAGRHFYPGAAFSQDEYIMAAKKAWDYLEKNNQAYTNDGRWNLVDEYCALLALTELYKTTREYAYLRSAREMARRIQARIRIMEKGLARLTVDEDMPFYHPADEGLPVIALLGLRELEDPASPPAKELLASCEALMRHTLELNSSCVNPFNYPRFLRVEGGVLKPGFFFPHDSTAEPWWQGENARIASLAAAARTLARRTGDEELRRKLRALGDDQINWILGLNPFDCCMMEGFGRNHIQYFFLDRYDFLNCPGGIVNGITSGLHDDDGIALVTEPTDEVKDNWRWAEQWLPHASWLLYALSLE